MPDYTPGIWIASGDQVMTIDGSSIIDCCGGSCIEEAYANAQLISAAPEMLEALKAAINYHNWVMKLIPDVVVDPDMRAVMEKQLAAIARAGGNR